MCRADCNLIRRGSPELVVLILQTPIVRLFCTTSAEEVELFHRSDEVNMLPIQSIGDACKTNFMLSTNSEHWSKELDIATPILLKERRVIVHETIHDLLGVT
jgi:hypothetical protein